MTTPPRRNLPPAAEAWGRYVDKRLSELEASDVVHRVNVGASIQSVASSSHHLGEFKRGTEHALGEVAERLEQLDEDLEVVGNAFTTSESPPTPEDAEGKPEGAYWTQIDSAGEQIARWRLVDGEWVDAPLGMTFIPEIGTDKIIASEAGFDTAVANQMFVDIFTANQVTADQIDVNSLAAHTGFIDNLFSHNLSLTGELTALSEDFTTVLSQAGVRMFANNSLVYEGDWEVPGGDAFSYGGWPGRLAISGDRILAVPTGQMHTRYAAFIYDLDGNQQGNPVQPESGWRFFELSANSDHFFALVQQVPDTRVRRIERRSRTGALQASFAQESGQPGTTRTSRLAALEDGTIALARGSEATQESWIDLLDGSDGSHIRRVATFPNTSNWGIQYLAATGDYIFSYISFGWPGAPRYISQHTIAGEHVRDIYIPGWPSSLSASGDTLWVGIQQVGGLILGYDINTGTATFVGRLYNRQDLTGGIQAPNGDIYGIPAFWEGADAVIIRRHSLSPEAHVRVAIDNFEGRLTAQRAEVEQLEVHETHAPPNGKTVAHNLVSGSFNTFQSLNEADQALFAPREGTRILVDGVEYIRRSGQWVPADQPIIGKRLLVNTQTISAGDTPMVTGFAASGDDLSGGLQAVSNWGIRVPVDGWYRINASMRFGTGSSSTLQTRIVQGANINNVNGIAVNVQTNSPGNSIVPVTSIANLSANTVVGVMVYSSLQRLTSVWSAFRDASSLAVEYIGPAL